MNTYKNTRISLGGSDIASIILRGITDNEDDRLCEMHFNEDGSYSAYLTENLEEIPQHYTLDKTYRTWLKIYDDDGLTQYLKADRIEIYRAGERGVLINLIGEHNEF